MRYLGTERAREDRGRNDETSCPSNLPNQVYIFLEYIPGGSLSRMLKQFGGFSTEIIRRYTRQILHGLVYLHNAGIIHRDIKPSNLLWTQNGTLMLIDFGAAVRGERGTLGHTIMTGTVGYQSPEQIYGEPQIASDLYSLGVVLVEILAGRTAFSMLEGQQLHWEEHISVPPIAILWLRRMLHPDVDMRFVSAELGALAELF